MRKIRVWGVMRERQRYDFAFSRDNGAIRMIAPTSPTAPQPIVLANGHHTPTGRQPARKQRAG